MVMSVIRSTRSWSQTLAASASVAAAARTSSWMGTWRGETSATNSPYSDSLRRGSGSARTRERAARCSIGTGSSSPAMATSKTVLSSAGLFPKAL
jgi:hypothetical protein